MKTVIIVIVGYYIIVFAWHEGKRRMIGFIPALFTAFLIPLSGIFIIENSRLRTAGCRWCDNRYNEAGYRGLCGKNEAGESKPGWNTQISTLFLPDEPPPDL